MLTNLLTFYKSFVVTTLVFVICAIPQLSISSEDKIYPGNNEVLLFSPGYDAPTYQETQEEIFDLAEEYFPPAKHYKSQLILTWSSKNGHLVKFTRPFSEATFLQTFSD